MASHFASRVARQAPERPRFRLYYGAEPLTRVLTRWVKSHRNDPLETGAASLMRQLSYNPDREALVGELVRLQERGSTLATYCVAVNRISGYLLPRDVQTGQDLLISLCVEGFQAAYVALLDKVTTRELKGPRSRELLWALSNGAGKFVEHCVLLYARAWLEGVIEVPYTRACQLAYRLLESARGGCWDALNLFFELAVRMPGSEFPREYLDTALDMLRLAAASRWSDAMYKYGSLYCSGHFLATNFDAGFMWLERSWKTGNLDAGCLYADLISHLRGDLDSKVEAQHILEKCCSYMHPQSMAALADLFMELEDTRSASVPLLLRAAELGYAEPLVTVAWENLMEANLRDQKQWRNHLMALARPPLDKAPCARHKRCLYLLMLSGQNEEMRMQTLQSLKHCASQGYGPAAASLAEIAHFGLWQVPRKEGQVKKWLAVASRLHEPRAVSLKVLREFEQLDRLPVDKRLERESELMPQLEWGCRKNDLLAIALTLSRLLYLTDIDLYRRNRKRLSPDRVKDLHEHCSSMLGYLQAHALGNGDLAVFVFLIGQFTEAYSLGIHNDFARTYGKSMNLGPRCDCSHLIEAFIFCAQRLGDPHASEMLVMLQKLRKLVAADRAEKQDRKGEARPGQTPGKTSGKTSARTPGNKTSGKAPEKAPEKKSGPRTWFRSLVRRGAKSEDGS